jgi:hypothetical protein
MTPGQRAYEARCAAMVLPAGHWRWAWGKLDDATRAAEEAGAQAAIGESDSTALAQLAMAQEAISDLAAERDRYRKALEEIAGLWDTTSDANDETAANMAIIAGKALEVTS